jgi:Tfp pilus assembly protein PilN
MLRQRLDFAHPQPTVKLSGMLHGGLVLGAAAALAFALVVHYQGLAEDMESAETRVKRLARSVAPGRLNGASREAMAEEIRNVNQAALRLTIPWESLFKTVEAAADKRVALLSLQPNFQKRELKITGEAQDYGAILKYIERLERGGALTGVRLVSHEVMARPNAMQMRFELNAGWRTDT